jgi:hypothetical protein
LPHSLLQKPSPSGDGVFTRYGGGAGWTLSIFRRIGGPG